MLNFPQTDSTKTIEKFLLEKLKEYVPKNEEVGIKKVVEFIKSARNNLAECKELAEMYREVNVATNPHEPDWLGFTYYYVNDGNIVIGLFQMNKKWWAKEEK